MKQHNGSDDRDQTILLSSCQETKSKRANRAVGSWQ